jgi:hypothetical protein
VVREASTAPPVGARFGFASAGKTFVGVVVSVRSLSRTHVAVEVEIGDEEFAWLREAHATD